MNANWGMLGHEWAVELLRGQVSRGEARHAYLLCGPAGVGRRTLALRLAQALNCTNPSVPGEVCGVCRDCKQLEAMQHPDLMIIQAESAGGVIKVDQVRELRRMINLKPYQARYRVSLFLSFHAATDNAANALLKTLEEAPGHAILVLTAEHPEQLLPTIVSRCEVMRLRPLSLQVIATDLQTAGLDHGQALMLAHLSGGRAGIARRLANDPEALIYRRERLNELKSLLPASRVEKFVYAEKLAKDRLNMQRTLLTWLSYWRDVYLLAAGASLPISNIDLREDIATLADRLELIKVSQVVRKLVATLEQLEKNVNARLAAEVLLLDWPS